jgi:hypothetical protein
MAVNTWRTPMLRHPCAFLLVGFESGLLKCFAKILAVHVVVHLRFWVPHSYITKAQKTAA